MIGFDVTLDLDGSKFRVADLSSVIVGVTQNLARYMYYLYLISNIEYCMEENKVVTIAVNVVVDH